MATSHFYLKNPKSENKTLIIHIFSYDGFKLKISTGISINPEEWNKNTQRVRLKSANKDAEIINDALEKRVSVIRNEYMTFISNADIPMPDELKYKYNDAINGSFNKKKKEYLFWKYFDEFVEYKKQWVSNDVYKDYHNSLRKHLQSFEKEYHIKLNLMSFKNTEIGVSEKFNYYLTYQVVKPDGEIGLALNTIGKQIKNLKVFLNYVFDKDICTPYSLKHLISRQEEVDKVFLVEDEISDIYNLEISEDIENYTELNDCKDMLIIGCETGLRFSDFMRVGEEHINDKDIIITPNKTSSKLIIPISSKVRNILKKHNNKLPNNRKHKYSVYDFNKNIRIICKLAGVNSKIVTTKRIRNKKEEFVNYKYELVSSHTCRRSFCTNKYLKGMPKEIIMKFSGHKTERSFMRYLKIGNIAVADKARDFF